VQEDLLTKTTGWRIYKPGKKINALGISTTPGTRWSKSGLPLLEEIS